MKFFFVLVTKNREEKQAEIDCYTTRKKALEVIANEHDLTVKELLVRHPELKVDEFRFFDEGMNIDYYLKKFFTENIE